MTLDVKAWASIGAAIANGGSKEDSPYRDDPEFNAVWDTIAADIAQMRQENPNVVIELPNELPDPDPNEPSWKGRPR